MSAGRTTQRVRGYILAEALVSAALASLAGALSVTLLIWSAEAIDRSQSSVGAVRLLDRLYEEARLLPPDDLNRPASGVDGRYQWVRAPGRALGDETAYAPVPVRLVVQWTAGGRVERRAIQAVVRPAAPATAPYPWRRAGRWPGSPAAPAARPTSIRRRSGLAPARRADRCRACGRAT